ncbi:MAG: dephospho-CoA kinase [Candidatus Omnitrophica bacterium]|nr:dephospho-CoA kinase [Candidatus Omnitrophota bacterium]MDD5429529.1 dephospho-CoA kinase [Candidatus Omnitrophota bacterium]
MLILGLTGNLASGKSSVLKLLKGKGAVVYDADRKVHEYYSKTASLLCKKVMSLFPEAKGSRGAICRRKLSRIVFADKAKLKRLEELVHPVIIKDMLQWIKKMRNAWGGKKKPKMCVVEVPLLYEKNLSRHFDGVILVRSKKKLLMERAIKKYKFSKHEAKKRLSLYMPIKEKIKRADYLINNDFDFLSLKKEVDLLWRKVK